MNASAVRAAVLVAAIAALAPASALARHLGPDELGPETRVGVINQAGEVDVGARDDSSPELQWGIYDCGREVAVGSSRYLAPEPMLQDPHFVTAMAEEGHSTPAYAYAGNNPMSYVDPDGRWLRAVGVAFYEWWKLRDLNIKNSDKYFHCMANCRATSSWYGLTEIFPGGLGPSDRDTIAFGTEFRETGQEWYNKLTGKGDSKADCDADRAANHRGQDAPPGADCKNWCSGLLK